MIPQAPALGNASFLGDASLPPGNTLLSPGNNSLPPGTRVVLEVPDASRPSGYRVETPGIDFLIASLAHAILARLRAEKAAKTPAAAAQPAAPEKRCMGGSIQATVFYRAASGGWKPLRGGLARHATLLKYIQNKLSSVLPYEVEFLQDGRTVRMTTAEYLTAFGDGKGAARG